MRTSALTAIAAMLALGLAIAEDALNADQYTRVRGTNGVVSAIDLPSFTSNIPVYNVSLGAADNDMVKFAGAMFVVVSNGGWTTAVFQYQTNTGNKVAVLSTNSACTMTYVVDQSLISGIEQTAGGDWDGSNSGRFYRINFATSDTYRQSPRMAVQAYSRKAYGSTFLSAESFLDTKFDDVYDILYDKETNSTFTVCGEHTSGSSAQIVLCIEIFL